MWASMAVSDVVFELDVLYIALTLLTMTHAISKRGVCSGVFLTLSLAGHTAAFEHISLWLGGTHCHATSQLMMLTPCSSLNSVLFYVPWTYTSVEAARRLRLHPLAFPFAVGLLQFAFGTVYEMQGPLNNFWNWPDHAGVIASSPALVPWHGYPPGLLAAQQSGQVGRVTLEGVWYVSQHASEALADRRHHFPILAPFFHFAFGFGWGVGLSLTGPISDKPPAMWRFIVSGMLILVLFVVPIEAARVLMRAIANPHLGVMLATMLFGVPLMLLPTAHNSPMPSSDPLLFLICLVMQLFFVTYPLRARVATPPELWGLVGTVSILGLAAQYKCCFLTGAPPATASGASSARATSKKNKKKKA